jgi:hypothetical protein
MIGQAIESIIRFHEDREKVIREYVYPIVWHIEALQQFLIYLNNTFPSRDTDNQCLHCGGPSSKFNEYACRLARYEKND